MKVTPIHLAIGGMTAVIVLLAWAVVYFGRDEWATRNAQDDEKASAPSRVSAVGDRPVIKIPPRVQAASGIETRLLRQASLGRELRVYGAVVNLQPLVELRSRYLAAIAETGVVRASLANSAREYERMRQLNQDDRNVSERAVQAAEARWRGDQARLAAGQQAASGLLEAMRNQWGEELTRSAADSRSPMFTHLLGRDEVIVQLSLPLDFNGKPDNDGVRVAPVGQEAAGRPARFLSASPQTDAVLPGKTYFYRVAWSGLRSGMRVVGRIRLAGQPQSGILVPGSAVVWTAGKAWVYIKRGEDEFERREVSTRHELGEGWFSAGGFSAGEQVVVRGAQLLLSEEFKYQIRNENED